MSRTVGRVDFIARMNGDKMASDAERQGDRAGREAASGFDKSWNKGYRDTLSKSGKESYDSWKRNGSRDGDIYGKSLNQRLNKFLGDARKNLADLRFNPDFLDTFASKSETAIGDLQKQIVQLHREGEITTAQFRDAKGAVDAWVLSQREGAAATEKHRQSILGLGEDLSRMTNERMLANIEADERQRQSANRLAIDLAELAQVQETKAVDAAEKHRFALNALRIDLADLAHEAANARIDPFDNGQVNVLERFRRGIDDLAESTGRFTPRWKNMSHEARQWTLIIGAVLAGMQNISVLGSAAGAGLVALGGAATSGIFGIGGLVATFVSLGKELEDLPEDMRPVAAEFKQFKGVFGELRTELSRSAFAEMPGTFSSLEKTLRSTTPQMRLLGTMTGQLISDFEKGIRPGTDAFEELTEAAENAVPNFRSLAGSTGTLGVALVRSFNEAQPLVADLLGYVDRLANQFDAFSRGTGMDTWISNAMVTWQAFGGLLDATGRALNDLVTPAAVTRTKEFLDNLSAFMPNLTLLLDNLGRADLFGIAAAALSEIGDALAPMAPAAGKLADAFRELAMTALPGFADGLQIAATLMAPIVELGADIIGSMPPGVIYAISFGIGALASSFLLLKGAQGALGAADALSAFMTNAGGADRAASGLRGTLMGLAGKAGAVGLLTAAVAGGLDVFIDWANEAGGWNDTAKQLVGTNATLSQSFKDLRPLDDLDFSSALQGLEEIQGGFLGLDFPITQAQFAGKALGDVLTKLDESMGSLPLPEIQAQFASWAEETGATDAQLSAMLGRMPGVTAALQQTATQLGYTGTQADILALALGEGAISSEAARQGYSDFGAAAVASSEQLALLTGAAATTGQGVDDLAEQIRNFGSATLNTREANRQFEDALVSLTESVAANGTEIGLGTAAARLNEAAVDDVAKALLEQAASTLEQTKSQESANQVIADGRQRLIDQLDAFGITGDAAEAYVDELGLIPGNVDTAVNLLNVAQVEADLTYVTRSRTVSIKGSYVGTIGRGDNAFAPPEMASGGLLMDGARHIIAGEDGPEAIVPLDRDLARVDPAVRWLSALAQGKSSATMGSGGVVGGTGGGNTVEAGAIVVNGSSDPYKTANVILTDLLDRIQD